MNMLCQAVMEGEAPVVKTRPRDLAKFSPSDFRQSIADLVAREQIALAEALADAGLGLYPESDEVLCMCALLASMRQDWAAAETHMRSMIAVQGKQVTLFTWRLLVDALLFQCEPAKALQAVDEALQQYPGDAQFLAVRPELLETVANMGLGGMAPRRQ